MRSRLYLFIAGAVLALTAAYLVTVLTAGLGMRQLFRIAAIFGPLSLMLLIFTRQHWLAFILIAWTISIRIPVQLFDAVTLGFVLLALIGVLYVIERSLSRKKFFSVNHWATGLLMAAGIILLVRFAVDRPGSARMGGMGGLRNAVAYTAAIPLFFITEQLAREPFNSKKIFRTVCIVALLMLGWRIGMRFAGQTPMPFYFGWYERSAWYLMPMALAWLIQRARKNRSPLLVPIVFCGFFILLAVLSPFRSRIYFAVASIAAVFWCFGYRRRLAIAVTILGCGLVPLLTLMPQENVPLAARRALSTILPYERHDVSSAYHRDIGIGSSEMGWASEFRRSLAEMALHHIRQTPWLGQGWGFTRAEVEWAMTFAGRDWSASGLVVAGDYHNCIMTIAVKGGLPAAIMLSIALIALLTRAMIWANRMPHNQLHTLYAAMIGAVVALFGQMLMNGSGEDLQAICILLGFFHGTRQRVEREKLLADRAALDTKEEKKLTEHE